VRFEARLCLLKLHEWSDQYRVGQVALKDIDTKAFASAWQQQGKETVEVTKSLFATAIHK
jgi:hypothetical protein